MQHLSAFAILLTPLYALLLSLTALLDSLSGRVLPSAAVRLAAVPLATAILFALFDNILRAAAGLIAMDERTRIRRFLSLRVLWRLIKTTPVLAVTQVQSLITFGPGWVVGDCLWPVICTVEKLSGKAAVRRSRELMTGLRSAGRALAIRHLALAAFAMAGLAKSLAVLWRTGRVDEPDAVGYAIWFPVFALFAAAPLFLYDRTADQDRGPLLQLGRTPEVPITARPLSVSSMIWLAAGVLYLLYQPLKVWLFTVR